MDIYAYPSLQKWLELTLLKIVIEQVQNSCVLKCHFWGINKEITLGFGCRGDPFKLSVFFLCGQKYLLIRHTYNYKNLMISVPFFPLCYDI